MDITFEKTGEARGVITANVVAADYSVKVDEELKKIGKTHVIPGFRKGHIALPELRKRFGNSVKSDVLNRVVIDATFDYIEQNKIEIIGQPLPAQNIEIDLKQQDYTFKYDVALWPELNIVLDKTVEQPFYLIGVSDKMIEDQDNQLRERFGKQVPGEEVDANAIIKGTVQELNADGSIKEGEDAIQVNDAMFGMFLFSDNDEAAKLIGKHVGDKVVFNPAKGFGGNAARVASLLDIDKEQAEGVTADFEVAIAEIIVNKPAELDQEFFDDAFGKDKVHNEEEYRATLTNIIKNNLIPNSFNLSNRQLHDYLMDTYGDKVVIDVELVKKWLALNNPENTKLDEEFEGMLPGIKWELISQTVVKQLDVKVTEEDLMAQASVLARQQLQQYGMFNADDEMIKSFAQRILGDKSLRKQIAGQVEELKLFQSIRGAITIKEQTISDEEFGKIVEGLKK